jgi:hypothetical protein
MLRSFQTRESLPMRLLGMVGKHDMNLKIAAEPGMNRAPGRIAEILV